MDEQTFIIESFRKHFEKYVNSQLVIYGLGKNTKLILDECKEYNIIGLMDGTRVGEKVWDLPVLSVEQLETMKVEVVVIIATSANVPIIYRRIADKCNVCDIKVYDINGELQIKRTDKYVLSQKYRDIKKETLVEKIKSVDVVSFDIFDTLLTRQVLLPTDLFEIINKKYGKRLPVEYDYVNTRINAERQLYLSGNPKISDIYEYMYENMGFPADLVDEFIELEICEEINNLRPRKEMAEIMKLAKKLDKDIYCTSDMYLPKNVLLRILEEKGITEFNDVIVSCEYGVSKCNGLFEVLRNKNKEKKILHIGDNYDADIKMATRYGIDETFEIASGYRMLQNSSVECILDYTNSIDERCILGEFISDIFNSPFVFEKTEGRTYIEDCCSMGYYYLEPIIQVFVKWLIDEASRDGINHLLLGSRDGYLIKEILDIYSQSIVIPFRYSYFYASRSACTVAGMVTRGDVRYAASLAYDDNLEKMMKTRFLLDGSEIHLRKDNETDEEYLEKHIDLILEKAQQYRKQYVDYCKTIINDDEKLGFFDFVSSGTCQLWLEKILDKDMQGYYFVRNIDPYKEHLSITALLKTKFVYEKQSKLYKDYIFLENILTSPEPTLSYVDKDNLMVFSNDSRTEKTINELRQIHQGIKTAIEKRKGYDDISVEFAEYFVNIIRPQFSFSRVKYFNENVLKDEFCNREFDLKTVMETEE